MYNKTELSDPGIYSNASSYLSILPLNDHFLDFTLLNHVGDQIAEKVLDVLMSDNPEISFNIPLAIKKGEIPSQVGKLRRLQITFEHFLNYKESLSLGYPMVLIEDESGNSVAAPLFIWKIDLSLVPDINRMWLLTPLNDKNAYLNPVLKKYIKNKYNLNWEEQIGLIETVNKTVINETCSRLSDLLNFSFTPSSTLQNCPEPGPNINNTIINGLILGAFEPFVPQENEKEEETENKGVRNSWNTKIPALPSDAGQNKLLTDLFNGHHLICEGLSGAGKTHAIASALPSLIAENGSVIIVSSNKSSFVDLHNKIQQSGIIDMGILDLSDGVPDQHKIVEFLEKLPLRIKKTKSPDSNSYKRQITTFNKLKKILEMQYEAFHISSVNGWNWTELMGHFLNQHHKTDKHILKKFLPLDDFDFSSKEHYIIHRELGEHFVLYQKINSLDHPLNILNNRFFDADSSVETTREDAKIGINLYRHKINSLYHSLLTFKGEYAEFHKHKFSDFSTKVNNSINNIIEDLTLYIAMFGDSFDKKSGFQDAKLKLLSVFSKKFKEVRIAKKELLNDLSDLKNYVSEATFFNLQFPDFNDESKMVDIVEKLKDYKGDLNSWAATIPNLVIEKSRTLFSDNDFNDLLKHDHDILQEATLKMIKQLNDDKILSKSISLSDNELPDKETFLYDLLMKFNLLERSWRDIDDFINWKKSWNKLNVNTQKVVKALVTSDTQDWLSGFNSWFYHQVLTKTYAENLPQSANVLQSKFESCISSLIDLRKLLCLRADFIAAERQSIQMKRIKKEKAVSLSKVSKVFNNKNIIEILNWLGKDQLSEFFPVVFASTDMALQLIDLGIISFDLLVIDNAQDLSEESGRNLLQLANQYFFLGRPDSDSTAIADNLLQGMLKQNSCKYHVLEPVLLSEKYTKFNNKSTEQPNAFQSALALYLSDFINEERIQYNVSMMGVIYDILIKPIGSNQSSFVIVCDSGINRQSNNDFQLSVDRIEFLKNEKFVFHHVSSVDWWKNSGLAMQGLLVAIIDWDKNNENSME